MLSDQNDATNLRSITRDDVMKLFMERIHPSSPTRSKLSIHLRSQAIPSPKFSVAASKELLSALQRRGIKVDVDNFHKLLAAEPRLADVQAFWSSHFKTLSYLSQKHALELLLLMETLTRTHPSEAESDSGVVPPGAQYIHDVSSFKAGLEIAKAASPVEIYDDRC
jgi:insulysin